MSQVAETAEPAKLSEKGEALLKIAEKTYARTIRRGEELAHVLWDYNNHLIYLRDQIRLAQPRTHGAVLLELERCGRGCLGCPHPQWVKWVNRNMQNQINPPSWFATRIDSPGRSARAKSVPQEARDLIAFTQEVIRKRGNVVKAAQRVSQVITTQKKHNPDLGS